MKGKCNCGKKATSEWLTQNKGTAWTMKYCGNCKPKLKFQGLDNIAIIGENNIPLSELFELHLKLENYLKLRPEAIVNESGSIVGFKNYGTDKIRK